MIRKTKLFLIFDAKWISLVFGVLSNFHNIHHACDYQNASPCLMDVNNARINIDIWLFLTDINHNLHDTHSFVDKHFSPGNGEVEKKQHFSPRAEKKTDLKFRQMWRKHLNYGELFITVHLSIVPIIDRQMIWHLQMKSAYALRRHFERAIFQWLTSHHIICIAFYNA